MPVTVTRRSRAQLHERLEARLPEIEQTILTRAHSLADPDESGDPTYVEGLQAAISAGLRYGLSGIDASSAPAESIPPELVSQARLAARNGVSLETVLRRYFAGYTLLGDFVIQEAKRGAFEPEEFQRLLRTQAELFDRLIAVVSEEYRHEAERAAPSTEERKLLCVERLLGGELADSAELNYELAGWHVGIVCAGSEASRVVRDLAENLDRRLLSVSRDEGVVWAWLGGRASFDSPELGRLTESVWSAGMRLAIGEPAQDLSGWRLTHRQATATLPIALRGHAPVTRYRDVAVLASVVTDDLLRDSLHRLYLAPLQGGRDNGIHLRETLEAYFSADRNVSAAASALGASRNTVAGRLTAIEQRIERSLASCAADLELALSLERLEQASTALY